MAMGDNVLQTAKPLRQDVIASDVRELKARMAALEIEIASLQKQMDLRFAALGAKSDAQFEALMAAIRESRAQSERTSLRVVASLSERVAILEAQRH